MKIYLLQIFNENLARKNTTLIEQNLTFNRFALHCTLLKKLTWQSVAILLIELPFPSSLGCCVTNTLSNPLVQLMSELMFAILIEERQIVTIRGGCGDTNNRVE